jgi:hypothetical protein
LGGVDSLFLEGEVEVCADAGRRRSAGESASDKGRDLAQPKASLEHETDLPFHKLNARHPRRAKARGGFFSVKARDQDTFSPQQPKASFVVGRYVAKARPEQAPDLVQQNFYGNVAVGGDERRGLGRGIYLYAGQDSPLGLILRRPIAGRVLAEMAYLTLVETPLIAYAVCGQAALEQAVHVFRVDLEQARNFLCRHENQGG